MRKSDSPYIADWFVVSLRWIVIVGLILSLAISGEVLTSSIYLLVLLIIWNVSLTYLSGVNKRLTRHRELSVGFDASFAALFFISNGGFSSPVFWVVLLPILTSTIYFEWKGVLAISGVMALVEIIFTLGQGISPQVVAFTLAAALLTLGLGALFGYISNNMIRDFRRMRNQTIEERERQQRVENERVRAIYSLTSTLTATLNYHRVLESALDLSLTALSTDPEAGPEDRLVAAVLLFAGDTLIVGSARRFTTADMRVQLPGQSGILAQVINDGDAVLAKSASRDKELAHIVALRNCNSIYSFPLRTGYNIYGVMIFAHPDANYFTPDRRDVIDILGSQLVIAIQNSRLYQDLADEKNRMVEVQEEARKKLARDLHDGPTQSVSAIAMRVNLARRMIERDPKAAADELTKIEELARRTTKEIRHMLFTLRPLVLESQGLVAALQAMAEKMKETYGQDVLVKVDESILPELEMGKQGVIFYIAEEAVNNARKHAQAPHIWVRLRSLEKEIALLEIVDDGLGFDVDSVTRAYDKRGSLGMVNLRERTELVSGLLHIDSAPGKGTKVQVYIPLSEDAVDRIHHSKR
jgi:signal transduction histidine kinase